MNKPKTAITTSRGAHLSASQSESQRDTDRSTKEIVGIITEVDPQKEGDLRVFVSVPDGRGGLRPFGQNKTTVRIQDSPLDILLRWGGVRIGMLVELTYRGIGETGEASAHIIGDENDEFVHIRQKPREGFSVAASLPFEPMGII
jgi:hypothetical protein